LAKTEKTNGLDIKQILLKYGNENVNLLNELSSNDESGGMRQEESSFVAIQQRLKDKYGI
jgi:hypothetical protein